MADDIIEIADDGRNDTYEVDGRTVTDTDVIARSRLRVESRKWLMSKLAPKSYGDRVEQVHSGGDKPIEQKVTRIELVAEPFPADHPKYKLPSLMPRSPTSRKIWGEPLPP